MVNCKSCGINREKCKTGEKITFHQFPQNERRRKEWVAFIGGCNNFSKYLYLCSKHFESKYFYEGKVRTMLRSDAIPTKYLGKSENVYFDAEINTLKKLEDTTVSEARDIIKNIILFFDKQKADGKWTIPLEKATELAAAATGESIITIKNIQKEMHNADGQMLSSSSKTKKNNQSEARNIIKNIIIFFDDQKENGQWTYPLEKATELAAMASGKSTSTIKKIRKEMHDVQGESLPHEILIGEKEVIKNDAMSKKESDVHVCPRNSTVNENAVSVTGVKIEPLDTSLSNDDMESYSIEADTVKEEIDIKSEISDEVLEPSWQDSEVKIEIDETDLKKEVLDEIEEGQEGDLFKVKTEAVEVKEEIEMKYEICDEVLEPSWQDSEVKIEIDETDLKAERMDDLDGGFEEDFLKVKS